MSHSLHLTKLSFVGYLFEDGSTQILTLSKDRIRLFQIISLCSNVSMDPLWKKLVDFFTIVAFESKDLKLQHHTPQQGTSPKQTIF
jgi:hypothetical protein